MTFNMIISICTFSIKLSMSNKQKTMRMEMTMKMKKTKKMMMCLLKQWSNKSRKGYFPIMMFVISRNNKR
jgi:hypothetical protein